MDYKELLRRYIGYVYSATDQRHFDEISFDVNTDDYLTDAQKMAICNLIREVQDE